MRDFIQIAAPKMGNDGARSERHLDAGRAREAAQSESSWIYERTRARAVEKWVALRLKLGNSE
jgi:hypothetical protein